MVEQELAERLEKALAACRPRRVPLSLVLVEIDRFDALAEMPVRSPPSRSC